MKYIVKHIIFGLFAVLLIWSCDSFLDEKPYSDITNENLGINEGEGDDEPKYTTAEQAEQLVSAMYNTFYNEYWQLDTYVLNDAQSDNAYSGEDNPNRYQIDEFRVENTNQNATRDWRYLYEHIAQTNAILTWVPLIKDQALTEARKNEILGEAAFVRALNYFNLVRIYKNVPLITQDIPEVNNENLEEVYPLLYPPQVEPEVLYAQVIEDLEFALGKVTDYSSFKFKVSKALVNLLLAEVYATKDGYANADWAKVKQYAEAVVSDNRYALMENFDDLFAINGTPPENELPPADLRNEHCKESIFELDCNPSPLPGNWAASMFYGIDWKKFNTPSQDLYRAYTNAGDQIRLNSSFKFSDVTGKWTDKYWPSNNFPYCYKMRARESANIMIYRLPEAILLLADAENELGNISGAQTQLNKIRNRVGLPNTTANTKEAMRLAIENEHRMEFAFEGKRWFDLLRRGRAIEVMKSCSDHQKEYAVRLNENYIIWPIPQGEIDLNDNLVQNLGY